MQLRNARSQIRRNGRPKKLFSISEYLHQQRTLTKTQGLRCPPLARDSVWLGIAPLGFVAYLGLNWTLYGHPFQFLEFQRTEWFKQPGPFWTGLTTAWMWLHTQGARDAILTGLCEAGFSLVALALCILIARRCRPSYAAYSLSLWLLITSTSFWQSEPRYVLSIFPLFLVLSDLTRSALAQFTLSFLFLISYALFLGQYVQGQWAF